jgi:hypothetical protein
VWKARNDLVARRPSATAAGSSPTAAIIERLSEPVRSTVSARIEADRATPLDETMSRTVDDTLGKVIPRASKPMPATGGPTPASRDGRIPLCT